jgi:murein DD-endopeptidase MepM/ murein hydrolase activator NlpD
MVHSVLASGQSLMGKVLLAASLAASASVATPALANSAAAASDAFRVKPEDVASNKTALGVADPEFRALHNGWGHVNGAASKAQVAVPSINPVESMRLTSQYGYRSDPFQGRRKNHKGLDIAGPIGTPIYATADGVIGRAQWVSGYGKYVEVEHGNAIQTRYGHLSAMNVYSGQRVRTRATSSASWDRPAVRPAAICTMKCASLANRSTRPASSKLQRKRQIS